MFGLAIVPVPSEPTVRVIGTVASPDKVPAVPVNEPTVRLAPPSDRLLAPRAKRPVMVPPATATLPPPPTVIEGPAPWLSGPSARLPWAVPLFGRLNGLFPFRVVPVNVMPYGMFAGVAESAEKFRVPLAVVVSVPIPAVGDVALA